MRRFCGIKECAGAAVSERPFESLKVELHTTIWHHIYEVHALLVVGSLRQCEVSAILSPAAAIHAGTTWI